jgi:hypothetical protein
LEKAPESLAARDMPSVRRAGGDRSGPRRNGHIEWSGYAAQCTRDCLEHCLVQYHTALYTHSVLPATHYLWFEKSAAFSPVDVMADRYPIAAGGGQSIFRIRSLSVISG